MKICSWTYEEAVNDLWTQTQNLNRKISAYKHNVNRDLNTKYWENHLQGKPFLTASSFSKASLFNIHILHHFECSLLVHRCNSCDRSFSICILSMAHICWNGTDTWPSIAKVLYSLTLIHCIIETTAAIMLLETHT